jgi:hypothetical protein
MKKEESKPEETVVGRSGKIKGHVRHRQVQKARATAYLTRATCVACNKVFRSPRKKAFHVASGHKSDVGWNPKRSVKRA